MHQEFLMGFEFHSFLLTLKIVEIKTPQILILLSTKTLKDSLRICHNYVSLVTLTIKSPTIKPAFSDGEFLSTALTFRNLLLCFLTKNKMVEQ